MQDPNYTTGSSSQSEAVTRALNAAGPSTYTPGMDAFSRQMTVLIDTYETGARSKADVIKHMAELIDRRQNVTDAEEAFQTTLADSQAFTNAP